jgi:hypothetical protein
MQALTNKIQRLSLSSSGAESSAKLNTKLVSK